MNKRNLLKGLILFIILFSTFHIINFRINRNQVKNATLSDLAEFTNNNFELIVSVVKEGEGNEKLFFLLNSYSNPVIVFDFDENPLVWNNAASFYKGEYEQTYEIMEKDMALGTVGVGSAIINRTNMKDGYFFITLMMLAIFFVLLHMDSITWKVFFTVEVLIAVLIGGYSPALLYLPFCLFAVVIKSESPMNEVVIPNVHLLFNLFFLYKLCFSDFNYFSIFVESFHSDQSLWLILFFTSCAFLYFSKIGKITLLILAVSTIVSLKLSFLPLCIIFLKKMFKKTGFSGHFFQAIIFAVISTSFFYFTFFLQLKNLTNSTPLNEVKIQLDSQKELEDYLAKAETGSYQSLLDFVKKSGLYSSKYDFEIAYFSNSGTVNSVYTRGLPEMLSIPQSIVIEEVLTANTLRKVIGGTARFKSGLLTLRISADYLNIPYVKPDSKYYSALKVVELDGNKSLKIVFPSIFFVSSDIAYFVVLLLMIFLVLDPLFSKNFQGLFEKAVIGYFTGFALITLVVGIIVIFYSSEFVKESDNKKLNETALTVKAIIDEYSDELSDNYLKWLGVLFNCNLSVYKNAVVTSSGNNLENPVLLPYSYYFNICQNNKSQLISEFASNSMFLKLKHQGFYCSVLQISMETMSKSVNRLSEVVRLFFIIIALMLSASFIITRLFTGKVVSPVLELVKSTNQITNGNYDINIEYNENDELGQLTDSINHMAGSIKDNYNNLISLIENLPSAVALVDEDNQVVVSNAHFSNISEEVKKIAMKISSKQGERHFIGGNHFLFSSINLLNETKVIIVEDISEVVKVSRLTVLTDMARKISHDIKNPLTPIKLNTEYLVSLSKKQPDKLISAIPKISENILTKINELKGISEAFSAMIKNEAIDNKSSFSLINFLTSHLSSYPELQFRIKGDDILVFGIELKLARVVGNLIENSVNFSKEIPKVTVTIEDIGDFAEIIYEDNGAGIPDENIESVFEPYFSTRESGTGLGLFIVREFMEESGGSIRAIANNGGAKFILTIKKA